MRDFGLTSFFGNAPDWSDQGKRQKRYAKALKKWEKKGNKKSSGGNDA